MDTTPDRAEFLALAFALLLCFGVVLALAMPAEERPAPTTAEQVAP